VHVKMNGRYEILFPRINVSGSAANRGTMYGELAREQIHRSINEYREVFAYYAKWDWKTVLGYADQYVAPISEFNQEYLVEMQGIATGANVKFEEILAINTRTEIMFAAKARDASLNLPANLECTSFSSVDNPRSILIGENWDWLTHCLDTVVILESAPTNAPNFVTIVEAGLLAKFGMNSAGLGVATNALVTMDDKGVPGIPYHIMLRALLGAHDLVEAVKLFSVGYRSSSANYVIAHRDGLAVNIEAAPGDWKDISIESPDSRGTLLHTNHFLSGKSRERDITPPWIPSTIFRLQYAQSRLRHSTDLGDAKTWKEILCTHAAFPYGICAHATSGQPKPESFATIASGIMDLTQQTMELSMGAPCQNHYEKIDYSAFFN
jgi:isopenicillin-N N-acyltransferase-like protein